MPGLTARRQRRNPWPLHQRLALLAAVASLFYFGGEMLEPLAEEGTHLLLESLEMLVEEFYEHVLHLPRREAEIITVWSGAIIGLTLLYFIVRAIVRRTIRAYDAAVAWCLATVAALNAWRATWSEADIAILAVAGGVVVLMLLSSLLL